MAVYCCCVPSGIDASAGVTVIDTSVTGTVTVNSVEPVILFDVARIDALPAVTPVASPCVPAVLLTVATVVLVLIQETDRVTS